MLSFQLAQFVLRDWTKIQVGYRLHYVITHFNVLAFPNGPIHLVRCADYVNRRMINQTVLFVAHLRTSGSALSVVLLDVEGIKRDIQLGIGKIHNIAILWI
uniref:Uncharacterized protein n=1 Tax=Opuntia streptacantha TaxID=393608 RepID=A0A7C8ZGM5_OPUST